MTKSKYDFGGYATKNNLKCTDGRIILKDAFKDNHGKIVPLVWQHMHNDPTNVLGHALLENREDGVYAYGAFNSSDAAKNARLLVEHRDITSLSIYANSLIEKSKNVAHGVIQEVSLVLSGANPGALIDNLTISHADGTVTDLDDEAIIYSGSLLELENKDELEHQDLTENDEETIGDVFNTLDDKQKTAVYAIIAEVLEAETKVEAEHSDKSEGEENIMKNNVFDGSALSVSEKKATLTHDQFMTIMADAKKIGSLKASFLAHAGTYGIDNIDYLFPDAQAVTSEPSFISRDMAWVSGFMNGTRHTPFSRIKSLHADITVETARALGYTTGNLKTEEVFALLRRITTPTTVYKKQKLDRDDIIDITDLDVVSWLKREMRWMLDEEIARAGLISDGRDPVTQVDDKIDETCIRPIWTDSSVYVHNLQMLASVTDWADIIDAILLARINYRGSGSPILYTTPTALTNMLLLKDTLGYRIYKTEAELAAALRVSSIVEVPVMENQERTVELVDYDLLGIIVNPRDYTFGADKGGQTSFFDDFDIDYNQYKYLLETRCSGALTVPKSAIVIERAQA